MTKDRVLLLLIVLFFLVTRIYKISEIPPSLYWDEASIGYNAYSILRTGRDEWGEVLPLHFRAFGEYKLPVYIYLTALLELILGFNEWVIRIGAVLSSLGSVLLTYFLALKLFNDKTSAILSAFFLSISPWLFIFSRTGYEASTGLMFFILGLYLFFMALKKKAILLFSIVSFVLSMYSYNSFRILTPFILLSLTLFFIQDFRRTTTGFKGIEIISFLVFIISIIPIGRLFFSADGNSRIQAVGIFDNSLSKLDLALQFIKNYFSHFSLDFLLFQGDTNLRSQLPGFGEVYWLELLLFIIGMLALLKKRSKASYILLLIVLISPIPAAITREAPHALRSITVVPFLSIITAYGMVTIMKLVKFQRLFLTLVVLIFLALFGNYYYNFMITYPKQADQYWQYGYKQLFLGYQDKFDKFDNVVVSDAYAQPYIFALFYLKYNPSQFRSEVKYNSVDKFGFSTVKSFGNFYFQPTLLENLPHGRSLVFASLNDKLKGLKEISTVNNLNGSIAFYVYEYQK